MNCYAKARVQQFFQSRPSLIKLEA